MENDIVKTKLLVTITDKDNGFFEQKKSSIREVANGEEKVSGL